MNRPITPKEAAGLKQSQIPEEVYNAFNELITKNLRHGYACFRQDDVVKLIKRNMQLNPEMRQELFDIQWLNIEEIYRKAGWKVEYDRPGYNENYPASFSFKWEDKE
jgi:hypothetical protein